MPLKHWRVLRTLHNPRYAGAFVYGRSRTRKTADGRITSEKVARQHWTALIHDAHPGYISWDQFETNQQLLAANAAAHARDGASSPPREGPALLQGLAVCGRCGSRMTIGYHQRDGVETPHYRCMRNAIEAGSPVCQGVPGSTIDPAIRQLLLDTVTPLTLEVALNVQAELQARADEADALRRSHVERARHQADLTRRRYMTVDPDNRLVADSLEADWNDALRRLNEAEAEYDTATAAAKANLSEEQKARIRALASDFPRLWSDPNTPARERKRIARLLLEDVTILKTDQIHLHVRFRGGQTTSLVVPIPLQAYQMRQTKPETLAALDRLLNTHTDAQSAEALNNDGHRSGTGRVFTPSIVLHLRRTNGLPSHLERLRAGGLLTIPELAERLGVSTSTIKAWHRVGLLDSRKANEKNIRLFEPPTPGDPRLVRRMGSSLTKRASTQPSTGGAV
jgi:DNA-binding transcriptional regulator YiaG